jgi:hypothetical protein
MNNLDDGNYRVTVSKKGGKYDVIEIFSPPPEKQLFPPLEKKNQLTSNQTISNDDSKIIYKDNLQTVDEIPERTDTKGISSNDNKPGNVREMTKDIEKKINDNKNDNKKGGTKKKHKNKKKRNKSLRRKS